MVGLGEGWRGEGVRGIGSHGGRKGKGGVTREGRERVKGEAGRVLLTSAMDYFEPNQAY